VYVADAVDNFLFNDVKMTDRVSTATEDETSFSCSSSNEANNLIDGIPSLDALSFEHELCPSQRCLCHNRQHLLSSRNGSGLSAFGVQASAMPTLTQLPATCSDHTSGVKDMPLSSLRLARPTFQPPVIGSHVAVQSAADNCDRIFGNGHSHDSANTMQSFAQLSSTTATYTSQSAAVGPLTFEHSHHRTQLPHDPTQEFNLSDLQSVLQTTAEELLPVTDCPVHQHTNSVERFPACTCGQQASRLDDCSLEELAAYFDDFCYIPKNMSPMAEMMYLWKWHALDLLSGL